MIKSNTFKADNLKDFKRVIAALKGEVIEQDEETLIFKTNFEMKSPIMRVASGDIGIDVKAVR